MFDDDWPEQKQKNKRGPVMGILIAVVVIGMIAITFIANRGRPLQNYLLNPSHRQRSIWHGRIMSPRPMNLHWSVP